MSRLLAKSIKLSFVVFLMAWSASAGSQHFQFDRLNIQDGLVSPIVSDLAEDAQGYLWIATLSGLSRFDGTNFKNYHAMEGPCGLLNNQISSIAVGPEGNIYLNTAAEWSVLDVSSQCFSNFTFDTVFGERRSDFLECILPDTDSIIWLGTRVGISSFDIRDSTYTHHRPPEQTALGRRTQWRVRNLAFHPTNDNLIIGAVDGGLCYFDKVSGRFDFSMAPANSGFHINPYPACLAVFDDHTYWNGTWGNGMGRYDVNTRAWKYYWTESGRQIVNPVHGSQPYDVGNCVLKYDDHTMWIGYERNLGILSLGDGSVTSVLHDPADPRSISDNHINAILRTRSGVIYLGTNNGLSVFRGDQNQLERFDPRSEMSEVIAAGSRTRGVDNLMYYCLRLPLDTSTLIYSDAIVGGLTVLDLDNRKYKHHPAGTEQGKPRTFYDYTQLPDGTFIINSDLGIFSFDPLTMSIDVVSEALQDTLRSRHMFRPFAVALANGSMYIWSAFHLYRLDPSSRLTRINTSFVNEDVYYRHVQTLNDDKILIWLDNRPFIEVADTLQPLPIDQLPSTRVNTQLVQHDTLWIGTSGGGLYQYRLRDTSLVFIKRYTLETGMPSNSVTRLSSGQSGEVWGSAFGGIFRLSKAGDHIRHYNIHDGVELAYIDEPVVIMPDGQAVFDDRKYIYRLRADRTHQFEGSAYIESLEFPEAVYFQTRNSLNLASDQNSVTIHMGIVDHLNGPRDNLFYRLDGFDDDWQLAGRDRSARYTNLAPGTYAFVVQARNPDGIYSAQQTVTFHIDAAIYQRNWFIPALAAIGLAGIILLYRYRMSIARREEQQRIEHNREKAELELKALRSQMNPHFMFNSLNSIKTYILKADPDKAAEYLSSFAHLIRMILQNSRERVVTLQDELDTLLLYIELEQLRFRDGFEFDCQIDEGIHLDAATIPPMILQPYIENAIWHGLLHKDSDRQLSLRFSKNNGELTCSIEDNGIGRQAAARIKSKSATRYKSMGMGITSDRIDLLNTMDAMGIGVEVRDKLKDGIASGTIVEITIPYENNTY